MFGSWSSSGDRPGTSWERKLDPARPGVCPLPCLRRFYFTFMLLGVEKMGMYTALLLSVPVVLLDNAYEFGTSKTYSKNPRHSHKTIKIQIEIIQEKIGYDNLLYKIVP